MIHSFGHIGHEIRNELTDEIGRFESGNNLIGQILTNVDWTLSLSPLN